jgi:translation initiation factor IF-3
LCNVYREAAEEHADLLVTGKAELVRTASSTHTHAGRILQHDKQKNKKTKNKKERKKKRKRKKVAEAELDMRL